MSIVLGVNFTSESQKAAEAMLVLARRFHQQLILVHVLPKDQRAALGEPIAKLVDDALDAEAQRLRKLGGTAEVETLLREGEIGEELAAVAVQYKAQLLAISASAVHAALFGVSPQAERLLPDLAQPLLVIREGDRWLQWLKGKQPLRVMLGADGAPVTAGAVEWVRNLREWGPVEVSAVRLYWAPEEARRLGLPEPEFILQRNAEVEHFLEGEARARLGSWKVSPRLKVEPAYGRTADQLVRLAEDERADLLVLGTHHRRGWEKLGSVSHHALQLAKTSVAVIPADSQHDAQAPAPFPRVVVATDLSARGNAAVPLAYSAVAADGTVHLVHVARQAALVEGRAELEGRLKALVPASAQAASVIHVVEGEGVLHELLHQVERWDASVVCLSARAKPPLDLGAGVVNGMLRLCRRPLLLARGAE